MSTAEIGVVLGVSAEAVRRRMRKLGIPRLPAKARPERNVFWRGGRTVDKEGYVLLHRPDHPRATKGGYVREHRLVMEKMIGRYLEPAEVVDHDDRDTANNDPSNLRLFASNAEHLRVTLAGRTPNWTEDGKRRIQQGVLKAARLRASIPRESKTDDSPSP